jgi:penicillin-binding protein 1A
MPTRKAVPVHNLKVTRRGKVRRRSLLWRFRRPLFALALVGAMLMAGLVWVISQVQLPVDPRKAPVEDQTSYLCASDVQVNCNDSNAMAQVHGTEDRELVTWDQIPGVLRNAVIATEDKDFFKHGGVDPMGIARAAFADLRGSGVRQGGSTITQQYVKQAYLTSEQTATRKIKEAVMAMKLEQEISKKEILTRYLNTVYFGRGAYGVQAASRAWFDHDVQALNVGEAAFLAGLLRNPNGADPYRGAAGMKEATRRRAVTLERMVAEGYLTPADQRKFNAVSVDPAAGNGHPFIQPPPKVQTVDVLKGSEWGSDYYVEYVRQWLVGKYGAAAVYGGGLRIYTSLDLARQKDAFDTVTSTLNRPGDPAAAVVSVDDQGQIKAMMGGTDFTASKVNLATGRQGGGLGRQPGSTFKAFALAEAVHEGYTVQSVLPSPSTISIADPVCSGNKKTWDVKGGPGGSSSLITATKNSINTVYAQLMARLGPQKVIDMAEQLGVSAKVPPVCSAVLGSGEVSVLDMAASYSTFANQGTRRQPIAVTRVEFPDGRVDRFTADAKQILTPDEAGRVRYSLQQVIQGGTGAAAGIGRPAAGKTGTTQNNADSWFVGFTPTLTTAVWMGFPQGQIPMTDVHGVQVQGGNFPAQMWKKYMTKAVAGTPVVEFPKLDDQALAQGRTLDSRYGKTSVIAGETTTTSPSSGTTSSGSSSSTTKPRSTTSSTSVSSTSTQATTTRPPTTVPKTTTTHAGVGGTGTGGGTGVTKTGTGYGTKSGTGAR